MSATGKTNSIVLTEGPSRAAARAMLRAVGFSATFEIDPFRKHCLLNGLDDIGLTLLHEDKLDAYEAKHNEEFWLAPKGQAA